MGDSFDDTSITDKAWFKPAVAAWFALLLGGGLWFMPPRIHDSIASTLGLDRTLPTFALPIGAAGAAILCAAFALIGAILGWVIAARIGRPTGQRALGYEAEAIDESSIHVAEEEAFEEPRRRRVLLAKEDIDEEGIAPSEDAVEESEGAFNLAMTGLSEKDLKTVDADAEVEPEEAPSFEIPVQADAQDSLDNAEFTVEIGWEDEELPAAFDDSGDHPVDFDHYEHAEIQEADNDEALGDLSLDALLGRLEGALDTQRRLVEKSEHAARQPALQPVPLTSAPIEDEAIARIKSNAEDASEDDPVVAFLKREAERRISQPDPAEGDGEPPEKQSEPNEPSAVHATVRSVLDRMGQPVRHD